MNLYIYCIANNGLPILAADQGFAGGAVYSISYRDTSAIVSKVSSVYYSEENILLHEKIIERVMQDYTVMPMRFGTVLNSEDCVKAMLEQYYGDFSADFIRLENRLEMGVKVIWPVEKIKKEITAGNPGTGHQEDGGEVTPGTAYLKRRLREYLWEQALTARADRFIREINDLLSPCFVECRTKKLMTEKLVLNGAYLVPRDRVAEFKSRLRNLKGLYRECKFLLSGPWPPYNFVSVRTKV